MTTVPGGAVSGPLLVTVITWVTGSLGCGGLGCVVILMLRSTFGIRHCLAPVSQLLLKQSPSLAQPQTLAGVQAWPMPTPLQSESTAQALVHLALATSQRGFIVGQSRLVWHSRTGMVTGWLG